MAQRHRDVLEADELTEADKQILDVLTAGARTKGYITDETGLHRNTVANRLEVLRAGDAICRLHETTALYELEQDPREQSHNI